MISLTVIANQKKTQHTFKKNRIIIGDGSPSTIDLPLSHPELSANHVTIYEQNGSYLAINEANDPFVLLNELPFGKRNLSVGDVLKIYDIEIIIDAIGHGVAPASAPGQASQPNPDTNLNALLEQKIAFTVGGVPQSQHKEFDPFENFSEEDIAALVEEAEKLDPHSMEDKFPTHQYEEQESYPSKKHFSPEDFPFSTPAHTKAYQFSRQEESLDDLSPPSFLTKLASLFQIHESLRWKVLWAILGIIFAIAALITLTVYLKYSEQSEEQELHAARSVADSAMALLNAKLQKIEPQNQNWSDKDFLKESLIAILSTRYTPLCDFDSQGKFLECPYLLRIYHSKDLSRFLIVAQPAPSLTGWLSPKNALVLDSERMEIRVISDIKALNRLLLNTNTLDGINAVEVSELLEHGTVIPLASLGNNKSFTEFVPPQELGYVQPGAENLVYNAPRYYKLTEPLLEQAAMTTQGAFGSDNPQFLEQLNRLSALEHLVFYTTKGMEAALQSYQGLSVYAPHEGFWIGYITFDPQTRLIANSHLLMAKSKWKSIHDDHEISLASAKEENQPSFVPVQAEQQPHAIWFRQIANLATQRKQALEPLSSGMIALLQQHSQEINPEFTDQLHSLLFQYEQADLQLQAKISKALNAIYKDYSLKDPEATPEAFLSYVKSLGLAPCIENTLRLQLNRQEKETAAP